MICPASQIVVSGIFFEFQRFVGKAIINILYEVFPILDMLSHAHPLRMRPKSE
jgi:hypothetical protein